MSDVVPSDTWSVSTVLPDDVASDVITPFRHLLFNCGVGVNAPLFRLCRMVDICNVIEREQLRRGGTEDERHDRKGVTSGGVDCERVGRDSTDGDVSVYKKVILTLLLHTYMYMYV